jgi:hypothetical protein
VTCLRQVGRDMNEVREAIITAITPNGSATLPFVIPSVAEGSAVQSFGCNEFVMSTGSPVVVHREQSDLPGASLVWHKLSSMPREIRTDATLRIHPNSLRSTPPRSIAE